MSTSADKPLVRRRLLDRHAGAVVAIVVLALVLRLVGIAFGRPYVYHPDEWIVAKSAMAMTRTGDWNPHLFLYPSALPYAERFLVSAVHAATGSTLTTDAEEGPGGLPSLGITNLLPSQFKYVLAGRIFVAILGALTVLLVYLATRRLTGRLGALAAAGILAVLPLHAGHSHYLTTDVPTAAATTLTLWLALRAPEHWKWLVLSGLAAGVAASTKYNGGFVIVVPLVMHAAALVHPREVAWTPFLRVLILIVAASILGFVVATPAILFDSQAVLGGIALVASAYMAGHAGAEGDAPMFYLSYLFQIGVGPVLFVLVLAGIAVAVARPTPANGAILAFTVGYFLLIAFPMVRYERNLIPLLPFLAVLGGQGASVLWEQLSRPRPRMPTALRRGRGLVLVFVIAACAQGASITINNDLRLLREDTRTRALAWITNNLTPGSVIVREDFTPQVPTTLFRVGYAGILSDRTIAFYRSIGARYLIASSAEFERFQEEGWQRGFYQRLLAMHVVYDEQSSAETTGPRIVIIDLARS